MKIINITVCFLSMLGLSPLALGEERSGGLFVEPAVTYELANTSIDFPAPFSSSSGSVVGLGLGARIGFHLNEALFVGFDGRYAMPQFKDSSVNYNAKSISTNWGPIVGIQMPNLGLRLWGSYILGGDLDPEKDEGLDIKFDKAAGYRIGFGFHLESVSLNLEYQQLGYGVTTLEQIGPFTPGVTLDSSKLENRSWLASLSFPLAL